MSHSAEDELAAILEGARVAPAIRTGLCRYGALVLEANRRTNLTGAKSPRAFAEHLLDSLTVVPYLREPYIDVGSGAGLPGIPVAIATGVPVMLVEATAKKAAFLESVLERMHLSGTVVARRSESLANAEDFRERFASGTARAVSGATTVAELVVPFLTIGGVAVLQRGRLSEVERRELGDASLMLGAKLDREVILDGERRIIVLAKDRPTPARFPRRVGVPEKRPLCS